MNYDGEVKVWSKMNLKTFCKIVDLSRIVSDHHVSDLKFIKRSWIQRLFTLPFRPMKKYSSVMEPNLYILADGTLVCSSATLIRIKKAMDDSK